MSDSTAVVMMASIDAVARQSASVGLLMDLPGAVVVSHDLVGRSEVRRVITDLTGVLSDETRSLEHACVSCTVREDIVPTVAMLVASGRWSTIVLALPLTAAPEPVAYELSYAITHGELNDVRLTSAVTVVDLETFEGDLLGDDLLAERHLQLGVMDRRSVGEAVSAQIEFADVVVALAPGSDSATALLRHVVSPSSQLHVGWTDVRAADLVERSHDTAWARQRVDPLRAQPNGQCESHGVWTLDLRSPRPLHPTRLLARIEDLGTGRIRSRGHFWLPSRPHTACVWDGSGGQLSIGDLGPWGDLSPETRLVVTGNDPAERDRIAATFAQVVMTDDEARSAAAWIGTEDGFAPWLGETDAAA